MGLISHQTKTRGKRHTILFFILGFTAVFTAFLPPLFTTLIKPNYIKDKDGNLVFYERLAYWSWIPFAYDEPNTYAWACIYQLGPYIIQAFAIISMDALFMNIMNFLAADVYILQGAFRTIRERSVAILSESLISIDEEKINYEEHLHKEMQRQMFKCIKHLQMILRLCEKLENLYRYVNLGQVLTTLCIYCTSLYLLTTTPIFTKHFLAETTYIFYMFNEMASYCWYGNEIMIKARDLPDALFDCDWIGTPKEFKSCLLFTMIRMRRPLILTVGKFTPLTISTFLTIIKASYSYFAVINNRK